MSEAYTEAFESEAYEAAGEAGYEGEAGYGGEATGRPATRERPPGRLDEGEAGYEAYGESAGLTPAGGETAAATADHARAAGAQAQLRGNRRHRGGGRPLRARARPSGRSVRVSALWTWIPRRPCFASAASWTRSAGWHTGTRGSPNSAATHHRYSTRSRRTSNPTTGRRRSSAASRTSRWRPETHGKSREWNGSCSTRDSAAACCSPGSGPRSLPEPARTGCTTSIARRGLPSRGDSMKRRRQRSPRRKLRAILRSTSEGRNRPD